MLQKISGFSYYTKKKSFILFLNWKFGVTNTKPIKISSHLWIGILLIFYHEKTKTYDLNKINIHNLKKKPFSSFDLEDFMFFLFIIVEISKFFEKISEIHHCGC